MAAHLDRIAAEQPRVHAFISLRDPAGCLAEAAAMDRELAATGPRGPLHGLPVGIKDLHDAAGLPTTLGMSDPAATPAATEDSDLTARLRAAGAIVVGKTNVPPFGLGSHSRNEFMTTRNPFDTSRSAGGSSGGAAAALATGMVPIADGSDFMGSLRNPAGWCEVLSLRPTSGPPPAPGDDLAAVEAATEGAMARDPEDLALLHSVIHGPVGPVPAVDLRRMRVGWLADLGGHLPMERGVQPLVRAALAGRFGEVDDTALAPHEAWDGPKSLWPAWLVMRHLIAGAALQEDADDPATRDRLPAAARFEIDGLASVTGADARAAAAVRAGLARSLESLLARYDVLALPTAQVFPFPAGWAHPTEIAGTAMTSYHRWMEVTCIATMTAVPVLTVPAGRDERGLPMGVQVLAPHGREDLLLSVAAAWSAA